MKKIKTVFVIDRENNVATNVPVSENEWVLNGEGTATIKFDGTSCMFKDGKLFKRFDRKIKPKFKKFVGQRELTIDMFKDAPEGFIACNEHPDQKTGHWPGWVPVLDNDKWHLIGLQNTPDISDGTFELVGPKVNGNNENLDDHVLVKHGSVVAEDLQDRTFDSIRDWLETHDVEGLVFHHPDGRMAKIRRKDFGFSW